MKVKPGMGGDWGSNPQRLASAGAMDSTPSVINLAAEEDHPLDELLEDARMAAGNDWEENFVADMIENRKRYRLRWSPTPNQVAKLRQIAYEDWSD